MSFGFSIQPAILTFLTLIALVGCQKSDPDWAEGLRVNQDPVQINHDAPQMGWGYMGAQVTPVADFYVDARVLAVKKYRGTETSDILPFDVALGWGVMSDTGQLRHLEIDQGQRRYYYRWDHGTQADVSGIVRTSSNMHMIPATQEAYDVLNTLRPNQRVRVWGQLVNVKLDRYTLKTSTSRTDTWDGACEIIWVTKITTIDPTRAILDEPFAL